MSNATFHSSIELHGCSAFLAEMGMGAFSSLKSNKKYAAKQYQKNCVYVTLGFCLLSQTANSRAA